MQATTGAATNSPTPQSKAPMLMMIESTISSRTTTTKTDQRRCAPLDALDRPLLLQHRHIGKKFLVDREVGEQNNRHDGGDDDQQLVELAEAEASQHTDSTDHCKADAQGNPAQEHVRLPSRPSE